MHRRFTIERGCRVTPSMRTSLPLSVNEAPCGVIAVETHISNARPCLAWPYVGRLWLHAWLPKRALSSCVVRALERARDLETARARDVAGPQPTTASFS